MLVPPLNVPHAPRYDCSCVHRRHGQDLAPLLPPQLGSNDAVDTRSDGVSGLVDQDAGVIVESDDASVAALHLGLGSDDDGVAHVAALDLVGGREAGHAVGVGTLVFLDDDDDAVTWYYG